MIVINLALKGGAHVLSLKPKKTLTVTSSQGFCNIYSHFPLGRTLNLRMTTIKGGPQFYVSILIADFAQKRKWPKDFFFFWHLYSSHPLNT